MNRIWKFPLGYPEPRMVEIEMPVGAEIVHVAIQPTQIMLWAIVDSKAEKVRRRFYVIATDQQIPRRCSYVGTVHHDGYVWHVMEAQ